MRTRTLLLLAVACGLAILAAGVVQLLRISAEEEGEFSAMGEEVRVGDLRVVVESYDETAGTAVVAVQLGGVDDPDAADDFRLVAPDLVLRPSGDGDGACGSVTVDTKSCRLAFDLGDAAGGVRVLRIERGDDVARWELALP